MAQNAGPIASDVPVQLPSGMNVNLTIGAVVVSTWSSIFVFAVLCCVVATYYMRFPQDSKVLKFVVAAGWMIACTDTVANGIWSYDWTVTLWGSIPGAGLVPRAFWVNILCVTFSASLVQSFYAWRLWLMSGRSPYIPALVILATIAQFITGCYSVSRWAVHNSLMRNLDDAMPYAWGWLSCSIFADAIISASMWYLYIARTRNAPAHAAITRVSIRSIVSRSVEAGLFSLISQIMTFVLFKVNTGFYFFWNDVVLTKIYIFSLVITLNARRSSSGLYNMSKRSRNGHQAPPLQPPRLQAMHIPLESSSTATESVRTPDASRTHLGVGLASVAGNVDSRSWPRVTFADDLEAQSPRAEEFEEKSVPGLRDQECRNCGDEVGDGAEKWVQEDEDPDAGWGVQDAKGVWHPHHATPQTQARLQEPAKAAKKAKRKGRRRVD